MLKNDCFALPPGVDWTPVPEALALLRGRMAPVTAMETVGLAAARGRVLAEAVRAPHATPPHDNAAVDGYALAHASLTPEGEQRLTLLEGRAAAGAPFAGEVGAGQAVRVLTGAAMPRGADSVVMQEDVEVEGGAIRFGSGLKPGANRRCAGEDMAAGALALEAGRWLDAADLAQAASVGLDALPVRAPLRVAVLSSGDELREPGEPVPYGRIHDANRPMLAALAAAPGFAVIDRGRLPDRAEAVRDGLAEAAATADAVLVSGGASAGDEDHVARELASLGSMALWRVAVKPGRPLALGMVGGVPVFGLPGNPVAAFVCFLVFARPALRVMAGGAWEEPARYPVRVQGGTRKRPGRTEYLRARYLGGGEVEVFPSQGSGLIGGLRWSDGLLELDHDRDRLADGEMANFLPYAGLGLR